MAYKWGFLTTYWDDPPSGCIAGSDFFLFRKGPQPSSVQPLARLLKYLANFGHFFVEANIVFEQPLKKTI